MRFFDYTLVAGGKYSRREHESASLVRGAVEVFRDVVERNGLEFRAPIPIVKYYSLHWTSEGDGAALATFYYHQTPVTTSALLTGMDREADRRVVKEMQRLVVELYHGSPVEPAWDLVAIKERPVIVSLVLPSALQAGSHAVGLIADMETCLGAAFFESERTLSDD